MHRVGKITEACVKEMQGCLKFYVKEQGGVNRNRKFTCFNNCSHKHGDEDPSACIVPDSNDENWTCFSCGAKGNIFKAVEYKEGISGFYNQVKFISRKYNIEIKREEYYGNSKAKLPQKNEERDVKEIVCNYYYKNETSEVLYKISRREWTEQGARKKDFISMSKSLKGWNYGIKDVRHVIYKLPQVLEAITKGETIFWVEGEKCVQKIFSLGFTGTTTCGGARGFTSYSKEYSLFLKGANVVILPDNDDSGKAYAKEVLQGIYGQAKSVKIVELPGLQHKGDVVDWTEQGGTAEELIKLVDGAQEITLDTYKQYESKETCENETEEKSHEGFGGVIEEEFCYYKYYKDRRINLTNFIINPKYYVKSEDEVQIVGDVVTKDGIIGERVFNTSDFDDISNFKRVLNDFHTFYTGKLEELQYIKVILSSKILNCKTGVSYSGFHKFENEWCFVTDKCAVDSVGKELESLTMQKDYGELSTDILSYSPINREELSILAPALFNFSALKNSSTILGYICGLFIKEKLKLWSISYNHLLIEGESSSGKSCAIKHMIAPILSVENEILNAAQCTDFALNRAASSSNFVPVILEEYKPSFIGKNKVDLISGIMRNSYDNYKGIKGVANLQRNRSFTPRTSVILSGEVGIEETANVGRSLRVIFATSYFNENTKTSLEILKKNSTLLHKLGRSLLNGGLKMEENKIKELHEAIINKLVGDKIQSDRIKNSVANCILGIALLKSVFEELDLNMEESTGVLVNEIMSSIRKAAYVDLLDEGTSSKTVIEQSLETMNRMAANGDLQREVDYDVVLDTDADFVLRLNYTAFYDRFMKYCREHNVTHEVLPLSSFKKQLSTLQYCKCYNKPTNFSVRLADPREKKTFRSAVILVKPLRVKNIDVDFMVDDNLE